MLLTPLREQEKGHQMVCRPPRTPIPPQCNLEMDPSNALCGASPPHVLEDKDRVGHTMRASFHVSAYI